ncbi:MAG TPA: hypothetical protein VHB99_11710, partial [Pirellulales bacterium]|nr:hypothetical protein [Pirellulales bacterium]
MSDPSHVASPEERPVAHVAHAAEETPSSIILISYPKIVFLYPTFLASLIAAIYLSFAGSALDPAVRGPSTASILFLAVMSINLVVLGFDFPRTTSLTLF